MHPLLYMWIHLGCPLFNFSFHRGMGEVNPTVCFLDGKWREISPSPWQPGHRHIPHGGKDAFLLGNKNQNWEMPKRSQVGTDGVFCSHHAAQGQGPTVAVMSCCVPSNSSGIWSWSDGHSCSTSRPSLNLICLPTLSLQAPMIYKIFSYSERFGCYCLQPRNLVSTPFPPWTTLTLVSSFSVDPVQPGFFIYHLQPGLRF